MTTTTPNPQAAESTAADAPERPRSWGAHAVHFAGDIAIYAAHNRGDLAALRRMDPDNPNAAAFWRLLARQGLLGCPESERKWGLILHGIALMTRNTGDSAQERSAHNPNMRVGRALFTGGDAQRSEFYSETRFNRLLNARDDMLRDLLVRMFRMMASAGATFNWYEMAQFIRYQDYDDKRAEDARRHIAREYYRAAVQSAETDD